VQRIIINENRLLSHGLPQLFYCCYDDLSASEVTYLNFAADRPT
jgi:hypothetical protein